MLRKLWNAYSDFITLDWLVRRWGKNPMRVFGLVVVIFAIYVLYSQTLSVHIGQTIVSYSKYGVLHSYQVTAVSRAFGIVYAACLGLIGVACCLLHGNLGGIYGLALLRHPFPLIDLTRRYRRTGDTWQRTACNPHHRFFGRGSLRPFPWYFTKRSAVATDSVAQIAAFLRDCNYVSDEEQFGLDDHWQHPNAFEKSRCGDCEDHALWAWRKLCDAGFDAEFIVGCCLSQPSGGVKGHAWVVIREPDKTTLLETAAKTKAQMLLPFEEASADYVPYFSVDRHFTGCIYGGFVSSLRPFRRVQKPRNKAA